MNPGLPTATCAEISNSFLPFLFSHFADAGIPWKNRHRHNDVCTTPTTLMPHQAEHQGKAGGSKQQGEKKNRSYKAEIKMQNKSHNRRDQEQKKQIQETGTNKLDRWSDARRCVLLGFSRYDDALVPIKMAVAWMPSLFLFICLCWNKAPSLGQQAAIQNVAISCVCWEQHWQMGTAGFSHAGLQHFCSQCCTWL